MCSLRSTVSTLLEILGREAIRDRSWFGCGDVSTLLEILDGGRVAGVYLASPDLFQPFLRFWRYIRKFLLNERYGNRVSTLLEILD